MIKVSVIVAIYKVERYLERCLESIIDQTYQDLEIILVDDGSPDKCPEICDRYASCDKRVQVIHQNNQGSINARWNGMKLATGDFLSFIDGDDWLERDMYQEMVSLITNDDIDMVAIGYREINGDEICLKRHSLESGTYLNQELEMCKRKALFIGKFYEAGIAPALWNKLYRRTTFVEHISKPDSEIRMGEDAIITYPFIAASRGIAINNEYAGYNYRIIVDSMSRSFDGSFLDRLSRLFACMDFSIASDNPVRYGFPYYIIFLTQMGMEHLFARDNKMSFLEKKKIFDKYRSTIIKLDIDWAIEYESVDSQIMNLFNVFIRKDFCSYYTTLLTSKVRHRINRVFMKGNRNGI